MVTISVFEADPGADGPLVAGWSRERAGSAGAVLLRALRESAPFRFVELAADPAPFSGADPRVRVRSGRYEVVHDDGDVGGAGGVLLVDPYAVAPSEDAAFLAAWRRSREELASGRGYLGTRLHRATDGAELRWITLARWSSPLMYQRALGSTELPAALYVRVATAS